MTWWLPVNVNIAAGLADPAALNAYVKIAAVVGPFAAVRIDAGGCFLVAHRTTV
jgi:hypothetical protein